MMNAEKLVKAKRLLQEIVNFFDNCPFEILAVEIVQSQGLVEEFDKFGCYRSSVEANGTYTFVIKINGGARETAYPVVGRRR